ncbi:class I SAM-dependent methyltransferase [Sporomusa acidovorans]|uniref:Ribosomal RNA small subunit methyltransferase J n=1 Tax=Sporomusa acidovorans (strain ATCC 49682 / DSM 3132 / Mol) TaxID=1123286 RepID=A0ABZ3J3N7_SPOA4|nr:class I SAM-dependent methyltransferase [Sporomusa acidovorans]OZC20156.1 ribosomal RNA small subunit methyltransferase J [Sporomusa acidovorans DSM 3132]SDD43558.1 Putative SAM-dependent methyltransferase [Sporomusa acidovorans]
MIAIDLIVTTAQHATSSIIKQAEATADKLSVPFIPRKGLSLAAIKQEYQISELLVITGNGPVIHTAAGEYFFHLSMAELRIKNLKSGNHDHMTTAMGLTAGMSVLDCTLGLATDAIVASFVIGEHGLITGLESSPLIAFITGYGLQNFVVASDPALISALRRIKVHNADYSEHLKACANNSFDVVYFDPMFRAPIQKSSNVKPIRSLANKQPITVEAIRQACRVARKRVVVKETTGSGEFVRLGIKTVVGGKYSSIHYGVIDCGPWQTGGDQP